MSYVTPKRAGLAEIIGPNKTESYDTCTCKHCGGVWAIRSTEKGKSDPGGWCSVCDAMICPKCAGKPCFPFLKKLEMYENKARFHRNLDMVLR